MKNIDPEKSNSNQPPQIYICLVLSFITMVTNFFKEKKIQWPTTHTCSSSTISLQTPNPAMANHSQLISAAPTPPQMVVLKLEPPSH